MRQLLHLLIVDRWRNRVVLQMIDGRWLLPTIVCGERARAPIVVGRWLRERSLTGCVAGQWAGRIAPAGAGIDWLIAIAVDDGRVPAPCSWCRIDRLSPSEALIEYEGWAVSRVVAPARVGVSGPFGTLTWTDAVSAWVSRVTGRSCRPEACFRASSHEVVVAYRCRDRAVYFKGVASDCTARAVADIEAARAAPGSFERTIAHERRADGSIWRLTASCAGEPLPRPLDAATAVRIASDIGRLQRQLRTDSALRCVSTPVELDRVRATARLLLLRHGLPPMPARVGDALEEAADIETGWTPMDLDPANARVSSDSLQYFDLDARLAAPPLAIAIFSRRLNQRATGDCVRLTERIRRAFEESWRQSVSWTAIDIVSGIVDLTLGWDRVQRNVDRGELSGDVKAVEARIASLLFQSIR